MMKAENLIKRLGLIPHPEGGYYKENYRSEEFIRENSLPDRYKGERSFGTSIYFLLVGNQKSFFHKLKSDEIWHFYIGSPLLLHIIKSEGSYQKITIGNDLNKEENPQFVIPKESWFAAELIDKNSFSLIGATVAPGFDFKDFEIANQDELLDKFPRYKEIILEFSKNE